MLISHFPKPKDATYFLIIGNPSKNDIIAMKRVSFNRFATKNLTIALPQDFRSEKLELHLMCDSYIGLDQYHHIDLLNINAYLECTVPADKLIKKPSKKATPKAEKAVTEVKGFKSYKNIQDEVLADIFSDDDNNSDETRMPAKGAALLEADDADAKEFRKGSEEEEDDDYETIIEKELDNWF